MATGTASGVRAGRAFVEAGVNDAGFQASLQRMSKDFKKFGQSVEAVGAKIAKAGDPLKSLGKGIAAIGVGVAGPILGASKVFSDVGDAIAKASARTGIAVGPLSELGFAAEQSGTDIETLEGSIRKMQKNLVSAASGSTEAQVAFGRLGISVAKISALKPEDRFRVVSEAISRMPDPAMRAAAAMDLFGKSGTALLPMMADGAAGIDLLTKQARDLGLTMSKDDASSAELWNDTLNILSKSLRSIALTVGAAVVPTLVEWSATVVNVIKNVRGWIDANRPVIVVALKFGLAIAAVGGTVLALGTALSIAGTAVSAIGTAIAALGSIIGVLASPIALVIAGIGAATVAFFRFTETGGQALGWLGSQFGALADSALSAFKAMGDALAAGDIALAGRVLWAALNVQFLKGVNGLKSLWADWGVAVVDVFRGVSYSIAGIMIDTWAGLQAGFVNAIGYLRDGWTGFIGFLQTSWNNFGGFFAKVWARIKAMFSKDAAANLDGEIARINADAAGKNSAVNDATGKTVAERMKGRDAQLAGIEANRAGAQAALGSQQTAEQEARRQAAQDGLASGQADLQAAMEELSNLTGKAAEARAGAVKLDAKRKPEAPGIELGVARAVSNVDVKGSFSAAALRGIGAGDSVTDAVKDQTKATKAVGEKIDKVNRNLELAGRLA